jgi:Coenzyme PQQ synthesis protein D (PqqD)
MALSFSNGVAAAPDVMFQTVGEESVLLNLKTSLYMGLDPVGTRMWTLLTDADSIQAAYEVLLAEYEVTPEQLRKDLEEFLDKLSEHGLIEARPDRPAPANLSGKA